MINVLLMPIRLLLRIAAMHALMNLFSTVRVAACHPVLFRESVATFITFLFFTVIAAWLSRASRQAKDYNVLGRRYMFIRLLSPSFILLMRIITGALIVVTFNIGYVLSPTDAEDTFIKYYQGGYESVEDVSDSDVVIKLAEPRFLYSDEIYGLEYIANGLEEQGINPDILLDKDEQEFYSDEIEELAEEYFEQKHRDTSVTLSFVFFLIVLSCTSLIVDRYKEYNRQLCRLQSSQY